MTTKLPRLRPTDSGWLEAVPSTAALIGRPRRRPTRSASVAVEVAGQVLGAQDLGGGERVPLVGPAVRLREHQPVLVAALAAHPTEVGRRRVLVVVLGAHV